VDTFNLPALEHQQKTITWGILGCGNVTEVKSGPAFNKVPHSRLVAVMRRNRTAAQDYAKRHSVPKFYDSADALIADPEVDAVYVATPPSSHEDLAVKVAAAGKPCYVEKPMARCESECKTMISAFEKAKQPLFVAYYRRALPHFQRVKEMIVQNEFGALTALNYTFANDTQRPPKKAFGWRFDPQIAGGGLFWDLGSHALDLFDYWCGPLTNACGRAKNISGIGQVEETVTMCAKLQTGAPLNADWSFVNRERVDQVVLSFEKAKVRCSVFGAAELCIQESNGNKRSEHFKLPVNIQLPLISNVVATLRGEETALSSGHTARRTSSIIDTVTR
jgi:predicted dehydrogenase